MKTKIMVSTLYLTLLLLHGCGGGGSETPPVDTTPPNTPPETSLETQPPTVIAMTPANNAVMVDAQSNIELTFSEALDAATISRETVRLRFRTAVGDSGTTPASVTYDDVAHKVTINPTLPIHGVKLILTLSGIKDLAGNAIVETTYGMHTYVNPPILEVSHNPATDAIIRYYSATYANNLQTFLVGYNGAGADLTWINADDPIFSIQQYIYNPDNTVLKIISGPNSATITGYAQATHNTNGEVIRITRYTNAGANTMWGDADDVVEGYTAYSYDNRGNLLRTTNYTGAGPDQAWYTSDDFFIRDSSYAYDTSGNRIRARNASVGADEVWNTIDDTNNAVIYDHDVIGNVTRDVTYRNPGLDTLWFTADDTVAGYVTNIYNNNSQATQRIFYTSVGSDGVWFTVDDTISAHDAFSYDAQGNNIQSTRYSGRGADNVWLTGDDAISAYNVISYNALNNRTYEFRFAGSGPDTTWFTADDTRSLGIVYNTTF